MFDIIVRDIIPDTLIHLVEHSPNIKPKDIVLPVRSLEERTGYGDNHPWTSDCTDNYAIGFWRDLYKLPDDDPFKLYLKQKLNGNIVIDLGYGGLNKHMLDLFDGLGVKLLIGIDKEYYSKHFDKGQYEYRMPTIILWGNMFPFVDALKDESVIFTGTGILGLVKENLDGFVGQLARTTVSNCPYLGRDYPYIGFNHNKWKEPRFKTKYSFCSSTKLFEKKE